MLKKTIFLMLVSIAFNVYAFGGSESPPKETMKSRQDYLPPDTNSSYTVVAKVETNYQDLLANTNDISTNSEVSEKTPTNYASTVPTNSGSSKTAPVKIGRSKKKVRVAENQRKTVALAKSRKKGSRRIRVKRRRYVKRRVRGFVGVKVDRRNGGVVSPRHPALISAAVKVKTKRAYRAVFYFYAVRGRRKYPIFITNPIPVIGGIAEGSVYWNGKRRKNGFLRRGRYKILVVVEVKDRKGKVIFRRSKFWGTKRRKYHLKLR